MSLLRNIRLLLWRNYIKRKRACCSFLCELLFPIIVTLLFVGIYHLFSPTSHPDSMYLNDTITVPPLAGMGYRTNVSNSVIAVGEWPRVPSLRALLPLHSRAIPVSPMNDCALIISSALGGRSVVSTVLRMLPFGKLSSPIF